MHPLISFLFVIVPSNQFKNGLFVSLPHIGHFRSLFGLMFPKRSLCVYGLPNDFTLQESFETFSALENLYSVPYPDRIVINTTRRTLYQCRKIAFTFLHSLPFFSQMIRFINFLIISCVKLRCDLP